MRRFTLSVNGDIIGQEIEYTFMFRPALGRLRGKQVKGLRGPAAVCVERSAYVPIHLAWSLGCKHPGRHCGMR